MTVKGRCYHQDEVNYWLFGAAYRAISSVPRSAGPDHWAGYAFGNGTYYSEDVAAMTYTVDIYRAFIGIASYREGRGFGINAREAWAIAGFNNDMDYPAFYAVRDCDPCTETAGQLNGHWGHKGWSEEILF